MQSFRKIVNNISLPILDQSRSQCDKQYFLLVFPWPVHKSIPRVDLTTFYREGYLQVLCSTLVFPKRLE